MMLNLEDSTADAERIIGGLVAESGPRMLEVDMDAISPFAAPFAGPPTRKRP